MKNDNDIKNERLEALITLASSEEKTVGECLSDETVAAFLDQKLTPEKRTEVIEHIGSCPVCLSQCTGVISSLNEQKKETLNRKILAPVVGFAVAAVLVLFLYMPETGKTDGFVNNFYKEAGFSESANNQNYNFTPVALPWEGKNKQYSFASGLNLGDSEKAFCQGLYDGRKVITKTANQEQINLPVFLNEDKNWQNTTYSVYYDLGKWCYLIKTIFKKNIAVTNNFTSQQEDYLATVISEIENSDYYKKNKEKELAMVRIKRVKTLFGGEINSSPRKWKRIGSETDIIIQLLSAG